MSSGWCLPYPGDPDWVPGRARVAALTPEEVAQRREERQRKRLEDAAPRLRELMTKLVKQGIAGEVRVIAGRMGLAGDLPPSIIDAEPAVVFKLLKDPFLSKRLGLHLPEASDSLDGLHPDGGDEDARRASVSDEPAKRREGKPDGLFFRIRRSVSAPFRIAVDNPVFEGVVYVCIVLNCIFMFYESPSADIESAIPRVVAEVAGLIFLLIFTAEAAAKIIGFGLIYSVSWKHKPYAFEFWNRIDFVILVVNWLQYLGFLNVAGKYTTQVLRLSRCLKLVRLIKYSSIKSMADSLAACMKPLLLVVICLFGFVSIFGVLGMALFRGTFAYCTDVSLDGRLLEGRRECAGSLLESERALFIPRTWQNPPANFDTFSSSILTLWSVYSSNWIYSLYSAEDSNKAQSGIQPIQNQNEEMAILYFSAFVVIIRLFLTSTCPFVFYLLFIFRH